MNVAEVKKVAEKSGCRVEVNHTPKKSVYMRIEGFMGVIINHLTFWCDIILVNTFTNRFTIVRPSSNIELALNEIVTLEFIK